MEVFRITKEEYAHALTSSGSANRWNFHSELVLYTGASRSLSSLELIVHKGAVQPAFNYKVMVISIADNDDLYRQILRSDLPANWQSVMAYSQLQQIGSNWYESQESLVLKVPSAIIPYEYNYIINTEHPEFANNVKLVRLEDYFWDSRLVEERET